MTYFLLCTHSFYWCNFNRTMVRVYKGEFRRVLILRYSTSSSAGLLIWLLITCTFKTKIYTCLECISNHTYCSLTLMIGACARLRQVFTLPRSRDSLCLLSRKKAKPQLKYAQLSRTRRMHLKEAIRCIYRQTKKAFE